MIKKNRKYIYLILFFLLVHKLSFAQEYTDAEIKTGFIYRFGLNIKWKDEINLNTSSLKTDVANAITDIGTDWNEDRVTAIDVGKESFQNIRVLTEDLSNAQVNI